MDSRPWWWWVVWYVSGLAALGVARLMLALESFTAVQ